MPSAIDATKPADSGPALTSDLRANLAAAKSEIEALQTSVAAAGDFKKDGSVSMTGPVNNAPFVTRASAGTLNIGAAAANAITVTGTTTITAFDNVAAGIQRFLRFSGALILTHNATSLILPGAANITTVAGDVFHFVSLGSGNWACIGHTGTMTIATGRSINLAAGGSFGNSGGGANTFYVTAANAMLVIGPKIQFSGSNAKITGDNASSRTLTINAGELANPAVGGSTTVTGGVSKGANKGGALILQGGGGDLASNYSGGDVHIAGGTPFGSGSAGALNLGYTGSAAQGTLKAWTTLTMDAPIILKSYTVATLPTAASNTHAIAAVTDATSITYRGALTGGGSTKGLAYCDGSSWMGH